MVWPRAISAESVMMLRSRGTRLGRFHTSPRRRSCVYLSSAGATIRTSSRVRIDFDIGMAFVSSALADEVIRASDAIIAARIFIFDLLSFMSVDPRERGQIVLTGCKPRMPTALLHEGAYLEGALRWRWRRAQ